MNIDDIAGIRRTYELFDIVWDDGAKWTGYESLERAQDNLNASYISGARTGHVIRRSWTVDIPIKSLGIYRPGVKDEALAEGELDPGPRNHSEEKVR